MNKSWRCNVQHEDLITLYYILKVATGVDLKSSQEKNL